MQKTHFNFILTDVTEIDKNKLKVIKAIRTVKPQDSLVQVLPPHRPPSPLFSHTFTILERNLSPSFSFSLVVCSDSRSQCKEYLSKLPVILFRELSKEEAEKMEAAFKDTGAVIKLD